MDSLSTAARWLPPCRRPTLLGSLSLLFVQRLRVSSSNDVSVPLAMRRLGEQSEGVEGPSEQMQTAQRRFRRQKAKFSEPATQRKANASERTRQGGSEKREEGKRGRKARGRVSWAAVETQESDSQTMEAELQGGGDCAAAWCCAATLSAATGKSVTAYECASGSDWRRGERGGNCAAAALWLVA